MAVSDQGVGIPVAEQSHVFEKFFRVQRTDLRVGGTGLGLALSHEIVVAHEDSRAWRARARGSGSRSRPPDRRIRRRLRRIRFNSVPEHAFWVLPSDPRPSVLAMSNQEPSKARDTALAGALSQIESQFGKGTVMRMGDPGAQVKVEAIPTGALSLDLALGIGGVPRGRIVEVFGPESSGKTTLIYHLIAEAQKLGGVCAFIDAEHAMDPLYAQKIGVNIDELLVSQPDYGEQALEIADMLVRSGAVDVVAVDSVAALTPRAELEGQMGDQTRRPAGADDEPGDAQARRQPQPHEDALRLHEPDPREGRRDVRLAGDPAGRPRAEVLRLPAAGHPPDRDAEGRHGGGRQPRPRQGRQEQGRRAVPPGGVRHRVRHGHLHARAASSTSGSSTRSSRSPARSSPTATSGSARAATTPRRTWTSTPRSPRRSRPRSTTRSASIRTSWSRSRATRTRAPIGGARRRSGVDPERETPRRGEAFDVAWGSLNAPRPDRGGARCSAGS